MSGATSLAFRLFAIDEASPVFARLGAAAEASGAAVAKSGNAHMTAAAKIKKFGNVGSGAALLIAGAGLKMAADFQEGLTTLVTGAGESEKNLGRVGNGIKKIAVETGTSTKQLTDGMFMIESAGFHGGKGLDVLRNAAKGAKVGNADLGTTADAVTTLMKDYADKNLTAAQATNALIGTVKQGKTHMQDLAGAMAQVAPAAAAAHINMNEMLGAMATLTSRGVPAAKAATSLRQTILNLENPTKKAQKAFAAIGWSTDDLRNSMQKKGLLGTFKDLMTEFEDSSSTGSIWVSQLKKAAASTTDFTTLITNAPPKQRAFIAQLADMMGGTKSLQASLILASNSGLKDFDQKTKEIARSSKDAHGKIEGWSEVQKDLNFKFDQFRQTVQMAVLTLGQRLLPIFSKLLTVIRPMLPALIALTAAFLALAVIVKIYNTVKSFITIMKVLKEATIAQTIATWALNSALLANPITWVVLAVVALVGVIVFLATKTRFFQTVWNAVWTGIKVAFGAVIGFITGKFTSLTLLILGPIGVLAYLAVHWKATFNVIAAVVGYLEGVVVRFYQTFIYPIFHAIADLSSWLYRVAIKPAFNAIQRVIWDTGDAAKWLYDKAIRPAWNWISDKMEWLNHKVFKPAFDAIQRGMWAVGAAATWLYNKAIRPAWNWISDKTEWLNHKVFKPAVDAIQHALWTFGSTVNWLYDRAVKPVWDKIGQYTTKLSRGMVAIFDGMKKGIAKVWDGIKGVVSKPVKFVIETVYNGGIVSMWNKIAHVVGLDKLKIGEIHPKFAQGGVIPGNVRGAKAGKDSVTIDAMPGEHMWTVPEVNAVGGHGAMYQLRGLAKSGQLGALVRNRAGFARPGQQSTDGQHFSLGGWIPGPIKNAAKGIAETATGAAGALFGDTLKKLARGALAKVLTKPINGLKGMIKNKVGTGDDWHKIVGAGATKPLDWILDFIKKDDSEQGGGANVMAALEWAKKQAGKPYVWAGGGPDGWDCSGFMYSIQKVIQGKDPIGRGWSTFEFNGDQAPPGWQRHLDAPFKIGITNNGVGHTAGTLAGTNVEATPPVLRYGPKARGYKDHLFQDWYGFKPSMGAPSGSVKDWIKAGLGLVGQGSNTKWIDGLYKIAMMESGGNPNAVNNYDSNAAAGTPSEGLLQFIQPTFDAYAIPGHKNIWSPVDQVAADWGYIRATYGDISNVPGIASMANGGGYKPYASGGLLGRGVSVVGENGPEWLVNGRVIPMPRSTQQQLANGRTAAGRLTAGTADDGDLGTITVVVKSEDGKTIETKLVHLKNKRGGRKLQFEGGR